MKIYKTMTGFRVIHYYQLCSWWKFSYFCHPFHYTILHSAIFFIACADGVQTFYLLSLIWISTFTIRRISHNLH